MPDSPTETQTELPSHLPPGETAYIDIDKITAPAHTRDHSPESVDEMAKDLADNDQIQEITVVRSGDGFELIAGKRRLLGAIKAGWRQIRCNIRPSLTEFDKMRLMFVENENRKDASPFYQASLVERMLQEPGKTQKAVAQTLGKDEADISRYVAIAGINPDAKEKLARANFSFRKLRQLIRIENTDQFENMADKAIAEGWSDQEIGERIDNLEKHAKPGAKLTKKERNHGLRQDPLAQKWSQVPNTGNWKAVYKGKNQWTFTVKAEGDDLEKSMVIWFSNMKEALKGPPRRTMRPNLVSRNTAVVLPFADHSAAGNLDYFCEGLTQEIVHQLAGIEEVRLLAWSEGVEHSNAAIIVTGSVRKAEGDGRITMSLVDAASGCYLWSEAIDRPLDNIIAVQVEVAKIVAGQLKNELAGGAHSRYVRRQTENLAAYNLYVQGRYHVSQRSEEGLRRAVEFFEKAIVENAQYALAYSGLSDAYSLLGHYGVLSPAEVWTRAASNAAYAVLQDENSVEAHTSLAHVRSTQDWDWLGAEQEFQRAIALDPRYSTAHHWYAMSCLTPLARLDQACEELMLAQALDPISSIIGRDLARIYYYKNDYDAALEQCDHTIELNPHFSAAYWILGLVQEQRGDFDESAAAFQRAIQLSPGSPLMKAALGRTFALSGKQEEALRILGELHELAAKRYVSPFELAAIYFALGKTDEGFQWLAKAFQDRCFELICLRVDPRWESLRGNPRFQKLVEQLGLP